MAQKKPDLSNDGRLSIDELTDKIWEAASLGIVEGDEIKTVKRILEVLPKNLGIVDIGNHVIDVVVTRPNRSDIYGDVVGIYEDLDHIKYSMRSLLEKSPLYRTH